MTSLGLDYAALSAANPRLIYASISGYGQTGPQRGKGGFDLIAQGVSGIMSITGEPGGPPVKAGMPVTDLGAGLFALVGILAALEHRHRTGVGQQVDTSLVDAGVALSVWEATEYFSGIGVPQPLGSAHRMNAPYQAIRCADGYITLGAANERLFRRLCDVLGHTEWSDDPAFADNASRVRNREALAERIESITAQQPRSHWLAARGERHSVRTDQRLRAGVRGPAGPGARDGGRDRSSDARAPEDARLADQDERDAADVSRRAPLLGEHTDEVLAEAGFSSADVAALRSSRCDRPEPRDLGPAPGLSPGCSSWSARRSRRSTRVERAPRNKRLTTNGLFYAQAAIHRRLPASACSARVGSHIRIPACIDSSLTLCKI